MTQADTGAVIDRLLDQIKQLTLQNAILESAIAAGEAITEQQEADKDGEE